MAITPVTSYFWAFSHIAKATLTTGTTYNVEAFAVQSDQSAAIMWQIPQRSGTRRPRPGRILIAADQSQRADGFWEFQWSFAYLTFGMFKYIEDNQFATGSVWSANATVQTLTDNGTFQAYQCTCLRPVPGEHYEPEDRGLRNVLYRFVAGVLL